MLPYHSLQHFRRFGNIGSMLEIPSTVAGCCSELRASRWLAGLHTAFFRHDEVAYEEAGVGRTRKVPGWAEELRRKGEGVEEPTR